MQARGVTRALLGLAPFAGAALLAWLAVPVGSAVNWSEYGASVGMALLAGGLTLLTMMGVKRLWLGSVPSALVFLAAVGLLRNSAGGIPSGAGAIAIIPVFQTALYTKSRKQLGLVLGGLAMFYLLPILVVGPPAYPETQYRAALLSVTVSSIIGLATQGLVAQVRHEARRARSRGRMLEQVTEAVHGLFESPHVRVDVCQAAKSISDATVALLYEPAAEARLLCCTAMTELEAPAMDLTAREDSAVYEAFRSGRPRFITQDVPSRVGNRQLWEATGRPSTVLYQPLMKDQVALGVLVVGWPDRVPADGPRTTVAALLAHEAAAVIARADAIQSLTGEAQSDPLTGLPNRRAWDAHIKRALAENQELALAMLDFDHFKEFNDTYGHPAGDRLLKETAAVWRDQLRVGDLLARLGGEEFGLLLPDCDAGTASDIVERLRHLVPRGRTCSAGVAVLSRGESAEQVLTRADRALYRAKARGRDCTELSGISLAPESYTDPTSPDSSTGSPAARQA